MGFIWGLILVLLAFIAIVTIFDLVRRHLGAARTAGWVLFIVLLPVVGSLTYWVLRGPSATEIERSTAAQHDQARVEAGRQSTRLGG